MDLSASVRYYGMRKEDSNVRSPTARVLIVLSCWCWFLILYRLMQKVFGCENVNRYDELGRVCFAS